MYVIQQGSNLTKKPEEAIASRVRLMPVGTFHFWQLLMAGSLLFREEGSRSAA
jgi:hypothetical protein